MKLNKFAKNLFKSNRFLKIFSIVFAFVIWVVVATAVDPNYKLRIENVPVDIQEQSAALTRLGLSMISVEPETVEVEVYGARYVVGKLGPMDIKIIPELSAITNSGTQRLQLRWVDESGGEYQVRSITPPYVSVRIDRMDTKTLDVQANVSGVSLPDSYIKADEIITPEKVTLTGPIGDLNKVVRAFVNVEVNKSLTATETATGEIVLVDADGKVVQSDHIQMDYDTAEVTIPVLKEKRVELYVDFINVPSGFPLGELEYTLSNDSILIAGPQTLVDSMDRIRLGYVDFKRLDIGDKKTFEVPIPSGFDNVENIQSVLVTFETDDYVSKNIKVPEINVVNPPQNYDVAIKQTFNTVRVVGPADILEALTSDDLVAEVDLSESEVVTGQTRWPVKIAIPGKGPVWATGDYVTVVEISEKE